MNEFVLQNALVYDGTGAVPINTDIYVKNGVIAEMKLLAEWQSVPALDCKGSVITPSFIDIHRHCDAAPFRDADFGQLELAQGITAAISGNCGLSPVPLNLNNHKAFYDYIEPVVGNLPSGSNFSSYKNYIACLQNVSLPINFGFLAGLGAVRYAVKGASASRFTDCELENASQLISLAMECGAFGVSLGMMYRPECYTTLKEYVKMLRPVAINNAIVCAHIRGEGDSLVQSVQEVIKIAQYAGVRLNISHFKATGINNWNSKIAAAIDCIENARAQGLEVTADFYPYDGGSTTILSLLPPTLAERDCSFFATRQGALRLKDELSLEHEGWDNMVASIGWNRIIISSVANASYASYQGKTFNEAACLHGCENPADLLSELIAADGGKTGIIVMSMSWNDVKVIAQLPYTFMISDALYGKGECPHPRLYGAFPRMLQKLVHQEKILTFEQAIHKMTYMPALCAGIKGKGVLKVGAAADMLLFIPKIFSDNSSYSSPKCLASGLQRVYIGGQVVLQDDKILSLKKGSLLMREK